VRSAVTIVNPHIIKVIADERITDLRRDATPRPEENPKARRTLRLRRSAQRIRAVSAARAEQR
jgi:hypothetical protein